jgi:hypothetical protein
VQQTIYAKSYDGFFPLGLNVNVTSPLIKTVVEQVIYRIGYVLVARGDLLYRLQVSELFQVSQVNQGLTQLSVGGNN